MVELSMRKTPITAMGPVKSFLKLSCARRVKALKKEVKNEER
jgi:hypothetical protein